MRTRVRRHAPDDLLFEDGFDDDGTGSVMDAPCDVFRIGRVRRTGHDDGRPEFQTEISGFHGRDVFLAPCRLSCQFFIHWHGYEHFKKGSTEYVLPE